MLELGIWIERLPDFVLVTLRMGALLAVAPVFGSRAVPPAVRLWLALLLAVLLAPVVAAGSAPAPRDVCGFAVVAAREIAVGIVLGFATSIVLAAAQYGGRLAGSQIGFGFASSVDPLLGEQQVILDRLFELAALVLFVTVGAHRAVIEALAHSYAVVPLGEAQPTSGLIATLLQVFAQMLVVAVQIACPVVTCLLVVEVALALLSRSVPQFNLFSVGFGIRVVVGIAVAAVALPAGAALLQRSFTTLPDALQRALVGLQPVVR